MVREDGLAEMTKSGGCGGTTVKLTVVEWDRLPLVPVTATLYTPIGVDDTVEIVRVALVAPPAGSGRVTGWTDQVGQEVQMGGGEVVRDTVPLKPLRLTSLIVEVAGDP